MTQEPVVSLEQPQKKRTNGESQCGLSLQESRTQVEKVKGERVEASLLEMPHVENLGSLTSGTMDLREAEMGRVF